MTEPNTLFPKNIGVRAAEVHEGIRGSEWVLFEHSSRRAHVQEAESCLRGLERPIGRLLGVFGLARPLETVTFGHSLNLRKTMKNKHFQASFKSGSALSSVEEHFLHTEGVAGSSPAARTIQCARRTPVPQAAIHIRTHS